MLRGRLDDGAAADTAPAARRRLPSGADDHDQHPVSRFPKGGTQTAPHLLFDAGEVIKQDYARRLSPRRKRRKK
jgi:hypothetical protein